MYTILVTDSNELIATNKERIMRRSKLVDKLHFLVDPNYKGLDMSKFTVTMEYVLPVSRDYCSETLTLSEELYKDKLEYLVPFDTKLTKEPGEIEIQLTFTSVDLNADGTSTQYVRKTSPTTIDIIPISAWMDIIPDAALGSLDQRLLKADAMINAVADITENFYSTKADNIILTDKNKIQLTSEGNPIGNAIDVVVPTINDGDIDGVHNGILELDQSNIPDNPNNPGCDCGCDHESHPGFIEL